MSIDHTFDLQLSNTSRHYKCTFPQRRGCESPNLNLSRSEPRKGPRRDAPQISVCSPEFTRPNRSRSPRILADAINRGVWNSPPFVNRKDREPSTDKKPGGRTLNAFRSRASQTRSPCSCLRVAPVRGCYRNGLQTLRCGPLLVMPERAKAALPAFSTKIFSQGVLACGL